MCEHKAVMDRKHGELYCGLCGLVLQEGVIDLTPVPLKLKAPSGFFGK